MIKVDFPEPTDPRWLEWCEDCTREQALLNKARSRGIRTKVKETYKGQREVYLGLHGPFYGKCAYCESLLAENQPGDLDHYRPKNSVTQDGIPVQIGRKKHPGYYWLAYHWQNLLPACADCNRPTTSKTPGKRIGKGDEFPVRKFRACRQGEERDEDPLLLNPVLEKRIETHFKIQENGFMIWLSDRGEKTINLFGLNDRHALVQSRIRAFNDGYFAYLNSVRKCNRNDLSAAWCREVIQEFKKGQRPFSAAGRAGIRKAMNVIRTLPQPARVSASAKAGGTSPAGKKGPAIKPRPRRS